MPFLSPVYCDIREQKERIDWVEEPYCLITVSLLHQKLSRSH
jgi:hypothetical protein